MKHKPEIWKVQIPLAINYSKPECLIYNKDRSKMGQIPITEKIMSLFPLDIYKIYILGTMNNSGEIDVVEVVEDQDW